MSHIAKVETVMNNPEFLKQAFKTLGWEIKEKSKARMYYADPKRDTIYDFVAVNPTKFTEGDLTFDIGFDVTNGEVKALNYDPYGGSIGKALGIKDEELGKLNQAYAFEIFKHTQELEGYIVDPPTILPNGILQVVAHE